MSDSAPISLNAQSPPSTPSPETRPRRQTQLRQGDIIAFRTSPFATAIEYDKPLVRESLRTTYPTYLGVVKSSVITRTPSVVEGYASSLAPKEVEQLTIAYIGRAPPNSSMIETQGLVKFLPDQSLTFACIPIHPPSHPIELSSHHRPPLQVVGGGVLPFQPAFVYTAFAVTAHLARVHPGETSLKLGEGEPSRLIACASNDTTAIGEARARLWESLRDQPYDEASEESEPTAQVFTNIVIDVWTDLRTIGPVGEPIDLQAEISDVERAIDKCYWENPLAVHDWAQGVQNETQPASRTLGIGLVLAAGAGLFGSIFGGLIHKLRR